MKKILGLRTIIYYVANLDAAKKWYAQVFQCQPYFDEPYYVGFNIGGYELGLHPTENKNTTIGNNAITYWGVENIEQQYQYFIDSGASSHQKPNNVGGEIVVAEVKDPWGNIIGLIYNPHFKTAD